MLSRREFVKLTTSWVLATASPRSAFPTLAEQSRTEDLTARELRLLSSAIDEIIPEGEGMPSATAAGALEYPTNLGWQYPTIHDELRQFLQRLDRTRSQFDSLPHDQRVQVLKMLERDELTIFSTFTGYVYEAYYTRPRVLGLIACPGQRAEEDDLDRLLAPVRAMKSLYRRHSERR